MGNATFGGGLTLLLLGVTYALNPYGTSSMGWGNPWVVVRLPQGSASSQCSRSWRGGSPTRCSGSTSSETGCSRPRTSPAFWPRWEGRGADNAHHPPPGDMAPAARDKLPVHAVLGGGYMIPMILGFVIMGPLSGFLSDKYGAGCSPRWEWWSPPAHSSPCPCSRTTSATRRSR